MVSLLAAQTKGSMWRIKEVCIWCGGWFMLCLHILYHTIAMFMYVAQLALVFEKISLNDRGKWTCETEGGEYKESFVLIVNSKYLTTFKISVELNIHFRKDFVS